MRELTESDIRGMTAVAAQWARGFPVYEPIPRELTVSDLHADLQALAGQRIDRNAALCAFNMLFNPSPTRQEQLIFKANPRTNEIRQLAGKYNVSNLDRERIGHLLGSVDLFRSPMAYRESNIGGNIDWFIVQTDAPAITTTGTPNAAMWVDLQDIRSGGASGVPEYRRYSDPRLLQVALGIIANSLEFGDGPAVRFAFETTWFHNKRYAGAVCPRGSTQRNIRALERTILELLMLRPTSFVTLLPDARDANEVDLRLRCERALRLHGYTRGPTDLRGAFSDFVFNARPDIGAPADADPIAEQPQASILLALAHYFAYW